MATGDPHEGLLREIIEVMNELGPDQHWDTDFLTQKLRERGYWKGRDVKTPERTVNMYCSQNRDVFDMAGPNSYWLNKAYWKKQPG